jgi:hypothetical protein
VEECDLSGKQEQHWISCFHKKSHVHLVRTLFQVLNTGFSATPRFNCYNRYQSVDPAKVARTSPRDCMPSTTCRKWREKYVGGRTGGSAPEIPLLTQIPDTVSLTDQCSPIQTARYQIVRRIQCNSRTITVSRSRVTR